MENGEWKIEITAGGSNVVHFPFSILHFLLSCLLFTACSSSDKVSIEGRILHMNQATFYVYSVDQLINDYDTITVQGGRFEYERPISKDGVLVLLFPNYSQLPIFARQGDDISIDGDAAKLSELEVSGNDDNKLMTEWRMDTKDMTYAEQQKRVEDFVMQHTDSPVSVWLVRSYFIDTEAANFTRATKLLKNIVKAEPGNIMAKTLLSKVQLCGKLNPGEKIRPFKAKDINGRTITQEDLMHGEKTVVVWNTHDYQGQNMVREVGGQGSDALSICLDVDIRRCREVLKNYNATGIITICDDQLFESPLISAFGITTLPFKLKLKDGKVVE